MNKKEYLRSARHVFDRFRYHILPDKIFILTRNSFYSSRYDNDIHNNQRDISNDNYNDVGKKF